MASGIPSFSTIKINEQNKGIQVSLFQLNKKLNEILDSKSYFIFKNNKINYKF